MKKIIFLLLILSYVALPQAGKSVLTSKQRDTIQTMIGYVNVKTFGAVGDGIADNGTAFSSAMSYLSANGGGTLYIPEGTYITSQTITVPTDVNIIGAGNSTVITYTGSDRLIYLDATTSFIDNAEIKNLYLNCNGAVGIELATASYFAITLSNISNIKILNCSYGIYLSSVSSNTYKVQFSNIRVQGVDSAGVRLKGGSYVSFYDVEVTDVRDSAYAIYTSSTNVSFNNTSVDGVIRDDGFVGSWVNTVVEFIECDNPPQDMVFRIGSGSNSYYGVHFINVDNTKVSYGMVIYGDDNLISGLHATNSQGTAPNYPISLESGSSGTIIGGSKQTGYNLEVFVSTAVLDDWTIINSGLASTDHISKTIAEIISPDINSSSISNSNINMSTLPLYLTGNDTSKGSWRIKGLLGGSFIIEMDTADGNYWVTMSGATPDLYDETNTYISRVIADGGTIVDTFYLNDAIGYSKATGLYDSTFIWVDANFGVKKDANNKVTKLYDLFGNDLVQADTSKSPTLVLNHRNGLATIQFDSTETMAYTFTAGLAQPNYVTMMVANRDSNALDRYFVTTPNSTQALTVVNVDGNFGIVAGGSYVYNYANPDLLENNIYTAYFNGASSTTYFNGTQGTETGNAGTDAFGEENDVLYLNGGGEAVFVGMTFITSFIVHNKSTGRELPETFLSRVAKYDANESGIIGLSDTTGVTDGYVQKYVSGALIWSPDISTSGTGLFNPDGVTIDTTAGGLARVLPSKVTKWDSVTVKVNIADMDVPANLIQDSLTTKLNRAELDIAPSVIQDSLTTKANTAWFAISPTLLDDSIAVKMNRSEMTGYSTTSHTHTDLFDTLSISWGVLDTTYAGSLSGWKVPNDITITEISAYTDANTCTFNIEERAETTPNTAGTDVIGSDLVADTDQQETSTFTNATIAKNSWLVPTISATGDVSIFTISVRYIKTD